MHITLHGSRMCLCASCHLHGHPCRVTECLIFNSLFLALFLSVCLSFPLLFSFPDLNFFLHTADAKESNHWHSANWGVWPLGRKHSSHKLWAQAPWRRPLLGELLKSSYGTNPTTKTWCPRTCLTRNSTMRPSGKRYLHHCSFRSEKNQRTEDKLITLMKKVCCQLSPFLCVTQERRDPCTNLVR